MKDLARKVLALISAVRLLPHIAVMKCSASAELITLDLERWSELALRTSVNSEGGRIWAFVLLMTFFPEYRNVFYVRLPWAGMLLSLLCRPAPTLYIARSKIGPGLFIEHGTSTIITAKEIGQNCWVNQQVTIGFADDTGNPTLGDNVRVCAGAKVLGNIRVGNNCTIGANAVCVKDVPDNCTVVGVPAYIIRRNGVKTKEAL
jgi:serine O-acetyltransferase